MFNSNSLRSRAGCSPALSSSSCPRSDARALALASRPVPLRRTHHQLCRPQRRLRVSDCTSALEQHLTSHHRASPDFTHDQLTTRFSAQSAQRRRF
jgi:hypothetical protein